MRTGLGIDLSLINILNRLQSWKRFHLKNVPSNLRTRNPVAEGYVSYKKKYFNTARFSTLQTKVLKYLRKLTLTLASFNKLRCRNIINICAGIWITLRWQQLHFLTFLWINFRVNINFKVKCKHEMITVSFRKLHLFDIFSMLCYMHLCNIYI